MDRRDYFFILSSREFEYSAYKEEIACRRGSTIGGSPFFYLHLSDYNGHAEACVFLLSYMFFHIVRTVS